MKQLSIILILLFSSVVLLNAQNNKVSGTVISADTNEPLMGATVAVKGTTIGVPTDSKGKFSINVAKGGVLEVSYIGYQKHNVTIGNSAIVNIKLAPNTHELEDVVVVGYGTVKKTESTVSSSGIRAADMKLDGTTSFEQSLQGKLSGVMVINTEGAPGSAMSIEVRGVSSVSGSSEPLYVIDGMPINSGADVNADLFGHAGTGSMNALSSINPNDIESIEVLKDAAATAIYGSRGSNGVVLITTKTGKEGKAKVSFNYNHGVSKIIKKIEVLDPYTFAEYTNWARGEAFYSDAPGTPAHKLMPQEGLSSTKWQDLIYRLAHTNEYALSVSGGSKQMNYMFSGNFYDQNGIVIGSGFKRYSIRSNVGINLTKSIKLTSNTNLTRGEYNSVPSSVKTGDAALRGVVGQALVFNPAAPKDYQPSAEDEDDPKSEEARRNPYLEAIRPTRLTTNNRVTSNLTLDGDIIKNFKFRIMGGIDYNVSRGDTYYTEDTQQGKPSDIGIDRALAGISYVETMKWINENQLTYSNTFNEVHNLTATGVFSLEQNVAKNLNNSIKGFANDDLLNNVLQNGLLETAMLRSGMNKTALMSYTGRVNYNYDRRYLVTLTMRADGSSRFGSNNRYGYFPSFAGAWNIINEPYLKDGLDKIKVSNAKFRASWGIVGNQGIPPYRSQNTLGFGWYPIDGTLAPTAGASRLANPDLRWEETKQTNLGLDLGFFNEKLSFTFNVYRKITTGLLQDVIIPGSVGFTKQYQNSGDILNKGLELEVVAKAINKKNFQWRIMANISFNRNRILSLGDGVTEQFTDNLGTGSTMNFTPFIQKVGLPLGTLWGYKTNGIYQTEKDYEGLDQSLISFLEPGDINIVNLNGDRIISDDDRTVIGDVNPKYTFGITNQFTYKRLNLNVLITGKVGGDIYNQMTQSIEWMHGYGNLSKHAWDNRWQGPYSSNTYPKVNKITQVRQYYASDRSVEDGTYVRIKNVRLAFNFDSRLLRLKKFPTGSIFFNVDNVWTFTNYRGYDPEVSSYGQNTAFRGIDIGAYPQCRTYSFGINLNL